MTQKRRDFYVSLSYALSLSSLLAIAACSESVQNPSVSAPIASSISCDSASADYRPANDEESLRSLDLTPGRYEYSSGEILYLRDDLVPPLGVSSRESVNRNSDTREFEARHAFVCREGVDHGGLEEFLVSERAPASIRVREGGVDYAEREFALSGKDSRVNYAFNHSREVKNENRYEFEESLRKTWDSYRFVHTGYRTYALVARKRVAHGTLQLRVTYMKPDGNVIDDGDIFLPLPDVQF